MHARQRELAGGERKAPKKSRTTQVGKRRPPQPQAAITILMTREDKVMTRATHAWSTIVRQSEAAVDSSKVLVAPTPFQRNVIKTRANTGAVNPIPNTHVSTTATRLSIVVPHDQPLAPQTKDILASTTKLLLHRMLHKQLQ
jgi:hypothetical protein